MYLSLLANLTVMDHLQALRSFPSILIYSDCLGLSPHHMMELCCLVGVALSCIATAISTMRTSYVFLLLWALYLSIHRVSAQYNYFSERGRKGGREGGREEEMGRKDWREGERITYFEVTVYTYVMN